MMDENIDRYAAIIIPTLCRYDHLKRCVESLQNNSYAKCSELYIGLDYPPEDKYLDGYKKIEQYLDLGIYGFANVYVIKHDHNLGAVRNMSYLIKMVMERHETFIFSEDDNEFSVNYLEYMNKTLWKYNDDENVVAVSGYNYPMSLKATKANIYHSNTYFAAFGFGTWSKKFEDMQDNMTVSWLDRFYNDSDTMKKLMKSAPNQYCNFVKSMVGYTVPIVRNDEVWKMDLTYGLYMFSHNLKMVFPTISKVRNWGYDGSGVNCDVMDYDNTKPVTHRNFNFDCQILDSNISMDDIEECQDEEALYKDAVNSFFAISGKELMRTRLAYCTGRIFGLENIKKIIAGK